jgi:glycerol-3-phosphate dehydrogenase
VDKIAPLIGVSRGHWTAGVPLPGGDFPVTGVGDLIARLKMRYPFLTDSWAKRLVRAYGTEAEAVLGGAASEAELGRAFGATLTEREVGWLMDKEYSRTAEDVVWRRSKLGLRMTAEEIGVLDAWMAGHAKVAAAE